MKALYCVAAVAALTMPVCAIGAASAPAGTEDPCETVPRAVVGSVLRRPVVAALVRQNDGMTSCTFKTTSMYPYAAIGAYRAATLDEAQSRFITTVATYAAGVAVKPEAVGDIGDGAATAYGLLFARKDTAVYVFQVVERAEQAGDVAAEERLAKLALASVK